ncbi:NACHT domain-containing protein [Anabaena sp. CCY 9402-a]|uniref:NACHT C-terminal alpha/beta 1 domain-containing protein n=1 Tax=Anabaena sp. CCY 9402-a TaxID=3103867 RepID=UPI0039C5DAEB
MPRNIRWDESVLDNVLNLVGALLQLSEQQSDKLQLKPQLYVQWDSDKLKVTGYETKQTRAKISRTVEVGTKKEHLLKLVKNLKLPQRQTESGSSQQDKELQEVQYIFDSLRELKILVKDETTKPGYWKFTLTLKHQTATKEENLAVIKQKWDEHPKNKKQNSSANSQLTKAIDDSINWREVCTAMLESQQEAAKLRRKATEQGFEINVYVPLGLVERKQQQRRQQDEHRDRENVYELTQEVLVKTYEHGAFLREVITQQPSGNNKHIAIIGEPGAGKTTLLSTIASFIKDNTQDLPICISLASLQGRTIEEYLLKQWLTEAMRLVKSDVVVTPEIKRQLLACFGKERVWLLLDGVDEMGENSPVQALTKINRELTASLRQARVVLTCRLNVWDAQVNNTLTGFDTYKTQEFKPEQIDEFIQQWFERAGDLQKGKTLQAKLKETKHENIRKLVTNPLRLSLLCQTFDLDKQRELPETKAALYQRFTRYFYEWKSELFPELCNSDNLKDELHCALSKLAFAGINSSAMFRLRRSSAHKEMGERLFKLACDVGWLNLVDRLAENDEEVYAFFHPNFQEYFAALNVKDWQKDFFNHVPDNPTQRIYRIFEPQWREVILLWLGREDVDVSKEDKEAFIQKICEFLQPKNKVEGAYASKAYILVKNGIKEFLGCSLNEIIQFDEDYCELKFNVLYPHFYHNFYHNHLLPSPPYFRVPEEVYEYLQFPLQSKKEVWGMQFSYFGNISGLDILNALRKKVKISFDTVQSVHDVLEIFQTQFNHHELICEAALESLKSILEEVNYSVSLSSLVVKSLKNYVDKHQTDPYGICHDILFYCAENMSYPDFYDAWYQENREEVIRTYLNLPQRLQAAINKDSQLSQNIHLICIDTSQFIEPDNPAAEIYAEMVSQGCPEHISGQPNNMSALKVYFKLLKTDKRVVLIFHPGATNNKDEATYSHAFLNAISKFEGAICLISDPIPDYNTLKVFTLNQSVNEILEWLRPS